MANAITTRGGIVAYEQTASTWGTLVAPTTLDQILITGGLPLSENREVTPDQAAGWSWNQYTHLGKKDLDFTLNMPLRYGSRIWSFVAQIMGTDTKTGSADPYTHTMALLDAIDGLDNFGSLCAQLGPAAGELLMEWPSVKPYGFTISGPNGQGFVDLSVKLRANKMNMGADCTVTTGNFDSVTHETIDSVLAPMVPFGALRFRMNGQTGAALGASDNLALKSFSFSFNRKIDAEWVNRQAYASQWETAEPIEDGIPESNLQIVLGDYNALTYMEAFQDSTEQKAEFYFALDADHDIKLEFPRLKFNNPEASISGQGRIPQTLKFDPLLASAAPTGMTLTNWGLIVRTENATAYE